MKQALALLPFVACATAHAIFQELYVNGVSQGHLTGIRYPTYDGPITDVTSAAVACNGGPNPLTTPYSSTVIPIPAGATVTTEWHHTLDSKGTNDAADPIDASHKGPVMTYLAAVSNATQSNMSGLSWFKIYEDGYDSSTQKWAVDKMIANKGLVTFTIPSCIKAGHYFLRHELIALMECAQIQITGGGSASPSTVTFPGAYSSTDPGIYINIYNGVTNYVIPGPRPFTCGTSTSTSTTTTSTTTTRTTTTTSTSTSTTSTSTSGGGVAQKYGQCGGIGWTGPTTCVAGTTCTKSNDYYSQCL